MARADSLYNRGSVEGGRLEGPWRAHSYGHDASTGRTGRCEHSTVLKIDAGAITVPVIIAIRLQKDVGGAHQRAGDDRHSDSASVWLHLGVD